MTITNHSNLPQPLVDAITNDPYSSGDSDISVTRLIQPPRKVELERRHAAEITEDAADRIWALMGQLGHSILERAGKGGCIVERRFFAEVSGWKVSGAVDLIPASQTEQIYSMVDYKFTSLWAVKEGMKPEWEQQLNLNRWLCHTNGIEVNKLEIVAILRDWSKPEASRNPELPQAQVIVLPSRLWTMKEAEDFMDNRVKLHQRARLGNGSLSDCLPEEMWERKKVWAVKKIGAKKASRLYDTEDEAKFALRAGQEIEHRPGERMRCQHYCSGAPWCDQFKAWKESHA